MNFREIFDRLLIYMRDISRRLETAKAPITYSNIAPILMHDHAIEAASCAISSHFLGNQLLTIEVMCRKIVELYFGIKYLYQADTQLRSQLFTVSELEAERNKLNYFVQNTSSAQRLAAAVRRDTTVQNIGTPQFDPNTRISEIDQILNSELQTAKAIYDASGQRSNWFSLNNGPRSIDQLSRVTGDPATYEILYRILSSAVHGSGLLRRNALHLGFADRNISTYYASTLRNLVIFLININDIVIDNELSALQDDNTRWYIESGLREYVNNQWQNVT